MKRLFIVLCVLVAAVWIFFPRTKNPYGRETYILVSDPMVVASWNSSDRILSLILFPSDISAEGTHGYGTYSLEAFWRLGEIEKKDGTVLSESISEALGIPITGYIGPKNGTFLYEKDALATMKKIFSLQNSIPGRFRTNISLMKYINLAWIIHFFRPDRVRMYDFSRNSIAVGEDQLLPDGSSVRILVPERIDSQLQSVFEDEAIRRESVTVAVYNTTDMPSLGNRVGRLLTNMGVSVVTVGNDAPEVDVCTVSGNETALKSKSTESIVAILGCTRMRQDTNRADLIVRIGDSYAKRFEPNR